jgi:Ricin-type beta-trefoil lectin domain/Cellulase (glycosyl hydrolase family 5)
MRKAVLAVVLAAGSAMLGLSQIAPASTTATNASTATTATITTRVAEATRATRTGVDLSTLYSPIRNTSELCLDLTGDGVTNGNKVQLRQCDGGIAQEWRTTLAGDIVSATGMCLDDAATSTAGAQLQVWQCTGDSAQRWVLDPGARQIYNKATGQALAAEGPATGTATEYWTAMPVAGWPGQAPLGLIGIAGTNLTMSGGIFIPYGFTLSSTEYPNGADGTGGPLYLTGTQQFPTMVTQVEVQLRAIVDAWHGNTVRLQIAQDTLLGPDGLRYLNDIQWIVHYAESLGLVVVLNDNTELAGTATTDEALPTQATLDFWELLAPFFAGDPCVIIDPFNEPRDVKAGDDAAVWRLWEDGGRYDYNGSGVRLPAPIQGISAQSLVSLLRAMGYTNQLWIETPALTVQALGMLVRHWSAYRLSDPLGNLVYEYHHTTTGGSARTIANWDAQFGALVKRQVSPVVDGEWTQHQQAGTWHAPNDDTGECWSDAPVSVPRYLRYLQAEGIGLLAWTLGTVNPGGFGILNADHGSLVSTTSYGPTARYSCAPSNPTQGAGQDLMTWFGQQDG